MSDFDQTVSKNRFSQSDENWTLTNTLWMSIDRRIYYRYKSIHVTSLQPLQVQEQAILL